MSFGTKHGNPPPHSFIRRKLLVALLKQKNPSAIEFGNQMIEDEVDERVRRLKNKDRGSNPQSRDDVYYECLLRSHFDEDKAVAMLRNNRPNLVSLGTGHSSDVDLRLCRNHRRNGLHLANSRPPLSRKLHLTWNIFGN